jgi:transcription elongation GreA/GreB family factor
LLDKIKIHAHCVQLLNEKITGIQQLIADARAASNDDTKSSMGDKYETTREMMQTEINKLQKQLSEVQEMLLALKVVDPEIKSSKAQPGALVFTDKMIFYIVCGLGQITMTNYTIMLISPTSPMGRTINGSLPGSQVTVNNIRYKIMQIH